MLIRRLLISNFFILALIVAFVEKQIQWEPFCFLLLFFFFSLFLTIAFIQKHLRCLKDIVQRLSTAQINQFEPIEIKTLPKEFLPLVTQINETVCYFSHALKTEKQFISDAAHELRTPLAAIKTQAQVALKAAESDIKESALHHLIEGVDRSNHIIQQLLTLGRLVSRSEIMTKMSEIPLYSFVLEIVANLAPKAIDKDLNIELLPSEDEKIQINGNAKALEALVINLIDNAIQYTPSGGSISVAVQKLEDPFVVLTITDTGEGIPEILQKRLSDRLFKGTDDAVLGNGFGLAIVQLAAELHDAKIEFTASSMERGVEVKVFFPIVTRINLET